MNTEKSCNGNNKAQNDRYICAQCIYNNTNWLSGAEIMIEKCIDTNKFQVKPEYVPVPGRGTTENKYRFLNTD